MKKIGFIGVGVMGHHMVNNLIKNNYELHLYSRRKESLKEYQQKVACYDNIKDLCKNVDLIISCVGYPKDVLEVSEQVLKYAKKDSYYIDMTTSSPSLAEEIFFKGKYLLDHIRGGHLYADHFFDERRRHRQLLSDHAV